MNMYQLYCGAFASRLYPRATLNERPVVPLSRCKTSRVGLRRIPCVECGQTSSQSMKDIQKSLCLNLFLMSLARSVAQVLYQLEFVQLLQC